MDRPPVSGPPESSHPGSSHPALPGSGSLLTDYSRPTPAPDRVWLHVLLFVATFASCVFAGGLLVGRSMTLVPVDATGGELAAAFWEQITSATFLADGFLYAVPFLLFLTVHEFGHYIAARIRGVAVSLPYYIPIPLPGSLGTFGAVIRIKEPLRRTTQLFDVGASGPLAGFVVAVAILVAAVTTLEPVEYLLQFDIPDTSSHLDKVAAFEATGAFPDVDLVEARESGISAILFGDTPLYYALTSLGAYRVPPEEIVHYPLLLAGWLGLFFTALNLLPVGQLDGGHVVYALFGPRVHSIVARITTLVLLYSGGVGYAVQSPFGLTPLEGWLSLAVIYGVASWRLFERDVRLTVAGTLGFLGLVAVTALLAPGLGAAIGYWGWLLWVGLILFLIRVDHPPVLFREPLDARRRVLGYLCLVIFVLCFSIQPIQLV